MESPGFLVSSPPEIQPIPVFAKTLEAQVLLSPVDLVIFQYLSAFLPSGHSWAPMPTPGMGSFLFPGLGWAHARKGLPLSCYSSLVYPLRYCNLPGGVCQEHGLLLAQLI